MVIIKKVIGSILTVTLLFSAVSIYAMSDESTTLYNWYKKSFGKDSGVVLSATATNLEIGLKNVKTFYHESIKKIDSSLESIRAKEVEEAKNGIESYRNDTENRLNDTVIELKDVNFDNNIDQSAIEEVEKDVLDVLTEVLESEEQN